MTAAEDNKQFTWVNCSKFIAILAVIIDHTYTTLLYGNQDIAYASYFSVSLFIILSGMTSYLSNSRHADISGGQMFVRRCKNLIIAYCIAVAVYMIAGTYEFDFLQYLKFLVNFNAAPPHYFVLLYIQLMMVNRLLYNLLQNCPRSVRGYLYEAVIMGGIVVLGSWTSNYTNILDVYGGGGKLLGGTYLILYYLGMLVVRHDWLKNDSVIKSIIILVVSGCVGVMIWRFLCTNGFILENYVPFGDGFNPPGITLMTYGFCMLFITFGLFTLLERVKYLAVVSLFTAWCGKHTMYIFLYHILVMQCFRKYMGSLLDKNIWVARITYFLFMIAGCILIEIVIEGIRKVVRNILSDAEVVT